MPVYQFRCQTCGHLQETVRMMANCTASGVCDACTNRTERTYADKTNFMFRPKNYRMMPGEPGFDSDFEYREKHTKQWSETTLTRQKKYRNAPYNKKLSTGEPPEEGKPLSKWAEQSE